jgi:hypothetical protein
LIMPGSARDDVESAHCQKMYDRVIWMYEEGAE